MHRAQMSYKSEAIRKKHEGHYQWFSSFSGFKQTHNVDGQSLGSRNAEISRLIKTLTNLSNVNGYHRSDSVSVMLVIILILQLTRHTCV